MLSRVRRSGPAQAVVQRLTRVVVGRPAVILMALLLLGGATRTHATSWQDPHAPGVEAMPGIGEMIGCRLWLASLNQCLSVPQRAGASIAVTRGNPFAQGGPDYDGIKRDTYYFLGLQLSVIGVLYFMPESVSGWSDDQKDQHRFDKWWNNVTDPTWDDDDHYINYVLHPYWGGAYYVRARERGLSPRGAFWYSYLLSTMYEAGVEALFEPISIQDFFVTPIVGSWMGEYFMRWRTATRERMEATGKVRFRDKALLVMTDPLGNAADFVDRRLGRDLEFHAAPFATTLPTDTMSGSWEASQRRPADRAPVYGVTVKLRW